MTCIFWSEVRLVLCSTNAPWRTIIVRSAHKAVMGIGFGCFKLKHKIRVSWSRYSHVSAIGIPRGTPFINRKSNDWSQKHHQQLNKEEIPLHDATKGNERQRKATKGNERQRNREKRKGTKGSEGEKESQVTYQPTVTPLFRDLKLFGCPFWLSRGRENSQKFFEKILKKFRSKQKNRGSQNPGGTKKKQTGIDPWQLMDIHRSPLKKGQREFLDGILVWICNQSRKLWSRFFFDPPQYYISNAPSTLQSDLWCWKS